MITNWEVEYYIAIRSDYRARHPTCSLCVNTKVIGQLSSFSTISNQTCPRFYFQKSKQPLHHNRPLILFLHISR